MTTIYLINNGFTMNNLNFPESETLADRREKRILSIAGEEESRKLALENFLQKVNVIYSSDYVMSLGTAKYLAKNLELEINICKELGERVIGNLGNQKIRMVNELQENDFNYKLSGGESLNDVKRRMLRFLNKVLDTDADKCIAMFTHNVAITSLLSEYCTPGFNLDNRLILNYQEEAIVDGTWDGIKVIELVFTQNELVSISRIK